jgi:ATP-binding cassette subfamily B protein
MKGFDEFPEEDVKGRVKFSILKRLLPFLEFQGKKIIIALMLGILSALAASSLPLVFREVIDHALPSLQFDKILLAGGAYFFLLVFQGSIEYFQSLILGLLGLESMARIKSHLFAHILSLKISYFGKTQTGKIISRIESDTQKLFMLFSSVSIRIFSAALTILFSFVIMFIANARMALFAVLLFPVLIVVTGVLFKKIKPKYKKERAIYAGITGFLEEHLKAVFLLKNLGAVAWSQKKFEGLNEKKKAIDTRINTYENIIWFLLFLSFQLVVSAILYNSVDWVRTNFITIGTVWLFIQYLESMIGPVMIISEQVGEVQRAFSAAERIFEILDTEKNTVEQLDFGKHVSFEKQIRFKNVSFGHEKDLPVLKNISFTIPKGTSLGIVGKTGCGKTTLISLLAGLYIPDKGEILFDGDDIRELSLRSVRSKLSLILQEIVLFPGTIMENLVLFRKDVSHEAVIKATHDMGVHDQIMAHSRGFSTNLAENGKNLSSGERQLLSFARALAFSPEILIMDEATSAVDPKTERDIQSALKKLLHGRTSLIIAHRLSTLRYVDNIIVLDRGEIVEEGPPDTLLNNSDGIFATYYRAQMRDADE